MSSEPFESHGPGPLWLIRGEAGTEAGPKHGRPLVCELLDRAAVAELLLRAHRAPAVADALAASMGRTKAETFAWVGFLVALHGLGKASPTYQGRDAYGALRLRAAGFRVATAGGATGDHAAVTAREVRRILRERFGVGPYLAARLGHVVASPGAGEDPWGPAPEASGDGAPEWSLARDVIVAHLARFTGVGRLAAPSEELADDDASFLVIEELVVDAVRLTADRDLFPRGPVPRSVDEYGPEARARARDAIAAMGPEWRHERRS